MAAGFFCAAVRGLSQFGIFRDLKRFAPFFAAPAAFERVVFQPVNFGFVHGRKSGLERGEPVVVRPVERDGAERAAGQFGQRVMRDGFAAVEKEGNSVATKNPRQRLVITVEIAHEHGAIAETSARPDEFQNFARGKRRLGFGIGAGDDTDGGGRRSGFWGLGAGGACAQFVSRRCKPDFLRSGFWSGCVREISTLILQSGNCAIRWRHCSKRFADGGPDGKP